jgi:hypothetical protein
LAHPKGSNKLEGFLKFARFYRKFIKSISKMSTPLIELLNMNVEIKWIPMCEDDFCKFKRALTQAPILRLMDYTKR